MRKTNFLILLLLIITNQLFAQQNQSFAEYWFGVSKQTRETTEQKAVLKKSAPQFAPKSTPQSANGIITLDLSNPTYPSSFELNEKNVWEETYNDEDYSFFELNAPFSFSHLIEGAGASFNGYYWDGFTYSKNGDNSDAASGTGNSQGWVENQWGNMASGGIKTDANGNVLKDENGVVLTDPEIPYLLAYWGYHMEPEYFDMHFGSLTEPMHNLQTIFTDGNTYKAVGVYINNSPWPYFGNINGDGFARPFDEGDYFKLIIHGLDGNWEETGTSVTHYLAEYKNGELIQSPNWEWVDLTDLGEIGGLYYTLETTDADPIYGPNTAVYFCMDKLQIKVIEEEPIVNITMNAVSRTMELKNKATDEIINVGAPENNKYTFTATPGDYILSAYGTDGTTLNGTIEITITDEEVQDFQFYTITTYATNSGWVKDVDYSIIPEVSTRKGLKHNITLGSSITAGRSTLLCTSGDTYFINFEPSATRISEGYVTASASGTVTGNVTASKAIPMTYNYTITAPEDANVFVGFPDYSGYYFRPFTEIAPVNVATEDNNKVYSYKIAGNQASIYRVSQTDKTTYSSVFSKKASDEAVVITEEMLDIDPKTVDHNVSSNNGYNVSDIYLNINEKGHLKLSKNDTFQIVNIRAWQTNNNITSNLFLEPDYHYTVINESGAVDASVVTVNEKGLITAVNSGTAIILVTYDAINVASAVGGPFFSAIWPENTGVFVVTVDGQESGITPNITINEVLNVGSDKNAGEKVDAELDVFYYLDTTDGYYYTFTPTAATSVSLAQPNVGANIITYNGFSSNGVTNNGDGSYTLQLIEGRNIVKLGSATGTEYQVLTAKAFNYTITNDTQGGEKFEPGDKISVRFNTLYHPTTKLAGIYNMSAYIQYETDDATIINGTGNQYAFASNANAQTITTTIPADWDETEDFVLTNGVIKVGGKSGLNYGDPFGNHRDITYEIGRNPNFTAALRLAYFGSLPDIIVEMNKTSTSAKQNKENSFSIYPNPFTDHIVINSNDATNVVIYNLAGVVVHQQKVNAGQNVIQLSNLEKGTYIVKCGNNAQRIIK